MKLKTSLAIAIFTACGALSIPTAWAAEPPVSKPIVKVVGKDGKVTYTDRGVMATPDKKITEIRRGMTNATLAVSSEQAKLDRADKASGDAGKAPGAASTATGAASSAPASGPQDLIAWAKAQQDMINAGNLKLKEASDKVREQACSQSKQQLALLTAGGGRVQRVDEKGEKAYLSDAQVTAERERLTENVAKNCKA